MESLAPWAMSRARLRHLLRQLHDLALSHEPEAHAAPHRAVRLAQVLLRPHRRCRQRRRHRRHLGPHAPDRALPGARGVHGVLTTAPSVLGSGRQARRRPPRIGMLAYGLRERTPFHRPGRAPRVSQFRDVVQVASLRLECGRDGNLLRRWDIEPSGCPEAQAQGPLPGRYRGVLYRRSARYATGLEGLPYSRGDRAIRRQAPAPGGRSVRYGWS